MLVIIVIFITTRFPNILIFLKLYIYYYDYSISLYKFSNLIYMTYKFVEILHVENGPFVLRRMRLRGVPLTRAARSPMNYVNSKELLLSG